MSEVNLNIQKVINELLPEAIKEGLEAIGQLVENEAKIRCPVDDGTLRASISHNVLIDRVEIGSNIEYAPWVHQGTGMQALNGDGRPDWKGQKANPFLQNAIDENMDKLVKPFENLLEKQRRG